jgi:hypothetical protein
MARFWQKYTCWKIYTIIVIVSYVIGKQNCDVQQKDRQQNMCVANRKQKSRPQNDRQQNMCVANRKQKSRPQKDRQQNMCVANRKQKSRPQNDSRYNISEIISTCGYEAFNLHIRVAQLLFQLAAIIWIWGLCVLKYEFRLVIETETSHT